jgi:Spy/CpxP family protein refolding chaperone
MKETRMKSVITCLIVFVGATVFAPAYAQSGDDPIAALAQELNLTQAQKQQMRNTFFQFLQKQDQVPTPGQVAMENRAMLKDLITNPTFDQQKAQAFVGKVTAVMQQATLNRLQLRHDLYHQLDPQQQKQYLEIIQRRVAEMMQ